jgi:glycosyltransferase involved in cell wall biosynthesis
MLLSPVVSIIMPVYNSERYLSQAIQSILDQTYQYFELIVIDDGSGDSSWEIVTNFQKKDSRIRGIRQPENQGVAATSNHGLDLAVGKYIARMDSDDVSLPDRLAKQVNFLESHPDIGILGGRMMFMDESGELLGASPIIQGSLNIYWDFMFESPFSNTTVMFRKSLVERHKLRYDPSALYGEDYDLWCRFLPVTRGENLTSILLYCRLHSQSLTPQYANQQSELGVARSAFAVQTYLPELSVSKQEITRLQSAIKGFPSLAKRQRAKLFPIYLEIWDAFRQKHKEEDLSKLKRTVFAWAARMILYPPFQEEVIGALWLLTKAEWRWPLFLLEKLSYYWERRRF